MYSEIVKLNSLIKLINFVKFNCEDNESREYASSPIVGEILKELTIDLNEKINRNFSFEIEKSTPLFNFIYEGAKKNLEKSIEWTELEKDRKIKHIENTLSPYLLKDELINELILFSDDFHRSTPPHLDI